MKRSLFILLFLLWVTALCASAQNIPDKMKTFTLAHFEETGEYIIYLNDDSLGTCTYTWKADGTFIQEPVHYEDCRADRKNRYRHNTRCEGQLEKEMTGASQRIYHSKKYPSCIVLPVKQETD